LENAIFIDGEDEGKEVQKHIEIHDQPVETVKVELKLTGLLGPFWRGHYWYRARDGAFMRFEGPADVAGTKQMVVSFTGEQRMQRTDVGFLELE
jgi:hypothetical protein